MPWRNGGGSTTEIAILPAGAGLDNFDWRVSMATVAEAGPFSIFPGIDRTLSVLEGDGIRLDFAGCSVTLQRSSPPFSFQADTSIYGAPINGPITDLNVMTRRGRYRHSVTHLTSSDAMQVESRGTSTVIFSARDIQIAAFGHFTCLSGGATALIDGAGSRLELIGDPAIDCYLIELLTL